MLIRHRPTILVLAALQAAESLANILAMLCVCPCRRAARHTFASMVLSLFSMPAGTRDGQLAKKVQRQFKDLCVDFTQVSDRCSICLNLEREAIPLTVQIELSAAKNKNQNPQTMFRPWVCQLLLPCFESHLSTLYAAESFQSATIVNWFSLESHLHKSITLI